MKTPLILLTIFPLTAVLLSLHILTVKDDCYDDERSFFHCGDIQHIIFVIINLIVFAILLIIGLNIQLALLNLMILSTSLFLMSFINNLFVKSLILILSQLIFYAFLI